MWSVFLFSLGAVSCSLSYFPGGGNKGDVPSQQENGQPSEDVHHLQQRQRLEATAGPGQRPEGQQYPLWASECLHICKRATVICVFICVHFHQREALTEVDWSLQPREAKLGKSSARQSWVLWGCWAERSAVLIQSNKLTSHLRNTERKRCQTEAVASFFPSVFQKASVSWVLLVVQSCRVYCQKPKLQSKSEETNCMWCWSMKRTHFGRHPRDACFIENVGWQCRCDWLCQDQNQNQNQNSFIVKQGHFFATAANITVILQMNSDKSKK